MFEQTTNNASNGGQPTATPEHKNLIKLLEWPFHTLTKKAKQAKEAWNESGNDRVMENVCRDICIEDAVVDGRVVIALKVHGVVIDYVRHHDDRDPEGYLLHDGASELMKRMQQIRKNEYVRQTT